jgi:hypothetical protein
MPFNDENSCTQCGARLPTNSGRCASCGFDPQAALGAPPAESLAEKVGRLETDVAGLKAPKQSLTQKIKKALRS